MPGASPSLVSKLHCHEVLIGTSFYFMSSGVIQYFLFKTSVPNAVIMSQQSTVPPKIIQPPNIQNYVVQTVGFFSVLCKLEIDDRTVEHVMEFNYLV